MNFKTNLTNKRKCVGGEPNLNENQLPTWKRKPLLENVETFLESETDKPSSESADRSP